MSGSGKDYNSKKRSRKRKREVDSGVARPRRKDGQSGKERSAWKMSRMVSGGEEITTVERCGRMRETSKRRGRDGRAWSKMDGTARAIKKPWFF